MVTMYIDELIQKICAETGFGRAQVRMVVDSLFENITLAMSKNRRVVVNGFGNFELQQRAPRTGRNPHTGEAVPIPARVVPKFTPSAGLKAAVCTPIRTGAKKK